MILKQPSRIYDTLELLGARLHLSQSLLTITFQSHFKNGFAWFYAGAWPNYEMHYRMFSVVIQLTVLEN